MTGNDKVPRNPGVPLRTILRNFLNLVESCEAGIGDSGSTYEKEFQELKQFSENLKSDPAYLCKEGEKTVNRKKNRYKDILPFDYTRVILGDFGDIPGSDYINANFIKGASGSSAYVACQGPLSHTVNDFWRMVVECEVQVIVMACNEQESGKHKCENYWVGEEGVEREFGQVKIWLKKCRQVCPDFLVRTMRISYTTAKGEIEERNVCQFHYSAWPDHGVPTKVRPLLDMVRLIRDCQTSETLPVLVHCSAGCGRTGTICAIDYVWGLLRLGKLTTDFSLFHLVREMRRQRIAMVQTKDQYIMVHRAVKELFEEQLKIIDSHPYANVDVLGLPIDIKGDLEEHTYETVEYNPTLELAQYQSSTSVPPIPPPHGDLAVNSKLDNKEVENPSGRRDDEHAAPSRWRQQKLDDITVLSSDGEEVEKELSRGKKMSAILRKPSIVKIKSFFEKSKEGKKSGGTNLSRAKSDVSSSRFYAFNNLAATFTSRGAAQSSKSPTPSLDAIDGSSSNVKSVTTKQKPSKPPLFAKPLLPIKRSKSLKVGKESVVEPLSKDNKIHNMPQGLANQQKVPSNSTSLSSGVSNVTSYPIKVCIQQVEIPDMKKPVSTSVKPEIQTATTLELSKQSSSSSGSSWPINKADSNSSSATRPLIPPKRAAVKESSSQNRIKMGVAKEMEDIVNLARQSNKYEQLKKYDTVMGKNPTNKRTSLTRSQSHVWQPTKVQIPFRIFSSENIHQSGEEGPEKLIIDSQQSSSHASTLLSQRSIQGRRTFGSFDESNTSSSSKSSGGVSVTIGTNSSTPCQPLLDIDSTSDLKPIVRRRVPKTNPYANYVPGVIGSSTIPYPNSPLTPKSSAVATEVVAPAPPPTNTVMDSRIPKDLPQLKPGDSRSRQNSSESSSNTATPRSSLPGTPTQTIDSTYAQIMRSNMLGQGLSRNFGKSNGSTTPKSILKGSLSSTPSESDERLDICRQTSYSPSPHVTKPLSNSITPPQKINTVRIAMGIRERRNSFRQAVCKDKEDQTPSSKGEPRETFPINPRLGSDGVKKSGDALSNSRSYPNTAALVRSHKDYEPIWPENGPYSFQNGGSGIASDDSYINRIPLQPQVQQKISTVNYHPEAGSSNSSTRPPFYPNSQRSRSAERTLTTYPNQNSQPFQSRFDEIKLLLDELKAPNAVSQTQHHLLTASKSNPKNLPEMHSRETTPHTSSSGGLKHQRSLRTPSKSQYPQGLSCFTFRKPTSLESLTDSFHYDVKSPLNDDNKGAPLLKQNDFSQPSSSTPSGAAGRSSNDYVSLRQGRTGYEPLNPVSFAPRMELHNSSMQTNGIPIAPPRMKKLQKSSSTIVPMSVDRPRVVHNTDKSFSNVGSSSSWLQPVSDEPSSGSRNLPEVVRCANDSSSNQNHQNHHQSNANPTTSPNHIVKAMGIFQSKAANMRSKLSNWNDNKEKLGGDRTNGCSSTAERDELDGGFVATSSSSSLHNNSTPPNRPTPRHQYL